MGNTLKEEVKADFEIPWPVSRDFLASLPSQLCPSEEELGTMGYPWELLAYIRTKLSLLNERTISDPAGISDYAIIEGPVLISAGVRIMPQAVIKGPVWLGENVLIGDLSLIRGSFIGNGTVAGTNSEVVRAVIGSSAEFHRCFIGDSLIGNNVHVAGESTTANQRLDKGAVLSGSTRNGERISTGLDKLGVIIGDNTHVGARFTSMPGVKVGRDCFIGPGVYLFEDVPDNSRVSVRHDVEVKSL